MGASRLDGMLCAAVTRDGQLTVPDTRDGSLRQCVAKARGTARAASCACDSGGDEVCDGLMSFESPCLRRLLRSSRSKRPANVARISVGELQVNN